MTKTLLILLFFSQVTSAGTCFQQTFCSTGEAPRYILCGRGQDCSRAKDLGLRFEANCNVSWWLGDAQEMRKYLVSGQTVTVLARSWATEDGDQNYTLSHNGNTLTSQANPSYVFSTKSCLQK